MQLLTGQCADSRPRFAHLLLFVICALACFPVHTQILIGQTAGFSGPVAAGAKETTDGARLYIDQVFPSVRPVAYAMVAEAAALAQAHKVDLSLVIHPDAPPIRPPFPKDLLMTIDLRQLCDDFCDLARVPKPQLYADDQGAMSFHITLRDVAVDLTTLPSTDPHHAFALFHMGTPDPAHEDFARILQALLHGNFIGLNAHQPVFSCRPETRAIVMQMAIPLAQTGGEHLHRLIDQGVNLVLQWRRTHFLASADAACTTAAQSLGSFA